MKRMAKFSRILWIVTAMAATASPSWGQPGGTSPKARPRPGQQKTVRDNASNAKGPLADADYRAFAKAIESAIASGKQSAFDALIDWDSLFKTMAAGLDMTATMREQVLGELRQEVTNESGITGQLVKNSKNGGTFHFLRTRQSRGRQVVLFRMVRPISEGGFNYFEFVPARSPDGVIRAVDLYVYASGEFFSETLRRALLPLIASQSRSFIDKLLTREKDYVQDFPQVVSATQLMNQGKPAEALAIYKKLRPETLKNKVVLLNRMRAAQAVDQDEYGKVLEEYRKWHPNDASLDLISIDACILKNDIDGAMKAIDRVDKLIDGDPYLNITRANIREATGDLEGAKTFAKRAVDQEPTLSVAYFSLVGYSLSEKKYDDTLTYLKEMDQKLHLQLKDLSTVPAYAGFVKSPQYQEWLAYLKKKDQPQKASPPRQPNRPTRNLRNRPGMQKPGS